ncbi:MAG: hypothetical protein D6737_13130 [Chloroflexi bacterium]|nr:MAG: hypothetical protein CUN54_06260 [Phototrophicales bacterium]RMF78943.1 MAG: hypothetical protein D6737_13130 [Chloroflexota bacterium]
MLRRILGLLGKRSIGRTVRNTAIGEAVEKAAETLGVDDEVERAIGNRDISDTVNRAARSGDVGDLLRHVDVSRFVTGALSQGLLEQIIKHISKNGRLNLPDGLLPDDISNQLENALKNNDPDQLPTDRLTPDMISQLTDFFDNEGAN